MSDRKSIHQEIKNLSQRIQTLNEDMLQRNDLSVLDIDLLRKHTIDLYEHVNQLRLAMKESVDESVERRAESEKKAESFNQNEERVAESERKPLITLDTEPIVEVPVETVPVEQVVAEEVPAEIHLTENIEKEIKVEETTVKYTTEETPEGQTIVSATTETTVTEKTRYTGLPEEPSDLAGRLGNAPIGDLKRAISIAKKFEFINSLFGGNVEKYAYAIHRINNLNNGDEAFTYLHELKNEHKWDEEDSNFVELANMVRRRYLA